MTALRDRTVEPQVTTGPIRGSHKVYIDGSDGLRVPVRRVELSNGEHHDVYDTSGPYTDDSATIDLRAGLPALRAPWVAEREPVDGAVTQLAYARAR
jgi:phosphomethylpyrimidine synthase